MKKNNSFFLRFAILTLTLYLTGCSVGTVNEREPTDYLRQPLPSDNPEVFAPGIVSVKGRFEMGFTISPDGKSMAFGVAHESDPTQTNIRFLNWKDGDWSGPDQTLLPDNINTSLPMFGPEANEFFYAKADLQGENDIWLAEYAPHKIINATPLNLSVNSGQREAGHGKAHNGNFYFTSNRDDSQQCCGDIYKVNLKDTTGPERVTTLNSKADEDGLFLSPKEDYIIIQAWKNEYQSKHDLYISYKTDEGKWTQPARMNTRINSVEIEQRPFISADQKYLFFSRMSTEKKQDQISYESDIYWVSTSKVFKPFLNSKVNTFPVSATREFTLSITSLFKDINGSLNYSLALADGSPLPDHIRFESRTNTISGQLKNAPRLTLLVTVEDQDKNTNTTYIELIAKR